MHVCTLQGKPTHHAVKPDESGVMTVNGKPHGNKTTIEDLVAFLGKKGPGWPVALDKPVAPRGSAQSGSVRQKAAAPPSSAVGDGGAGTGRSWLHGGISREKAECK